MMIISSLFSQSQQKVITVSYINGNDSLCNLINSYPCKTLHTALQAVRNNDMICIHNGNYFHNTNTTLTYSNISITGNGSVVTIIQCNNNGTGFGFINVSNISISRLTLSGCGQFRSSTTINISSNSTMLFRAAIYFANVTHVSIDDVVISKSIGMGVAMYDVTGDVTVTNSIFSNNRVQKHEYTFYPGGGGFSVEFSCCTPGSRLVNSASKGASYLFWNCSFYNNIASTNLQFYATKMFGIYNQQFGRGGGLSVFFRGYSVQNKIKISNCIFDYNYAVWGGGFHSDIVDYSTGNVLILENCNFTNNHCHYDDSLLTTGTGGGGVRIALLFYDPQSKVNNNLVQFKSCRFQLNTAYYGGGLSCEISKENDKTKASNNFELVDCIWEENVARTGSGVDIISRPFPYGVSPVVKIVNCNFTANNNSYSNMASFSLGIGALYADNVLVNFTGNCIFTGNKDSAVAGIATHFIFSNNTYAMFYKNSGLHGAGMALLGNAYFIIYHNTSLQFIDNSVMTKGGAVYYIDSGQKDFASTQRCLMYYYDLTVQNHSDWATTLNFSGNYAYFGRSIYCTTLLTCMWGNRPGNVTFNHDEILQVFNWSGIFYYDGKYNRSEEIATDTADIVAGISEPVRIPPGKFYHTNISSFDDRRQTAYPVIIVETSNPNVSSVNIMANVSNKYVILHGEINSNISLYLHTFNNRPVYTSIDVTIDECPPGFHYPFSEDKSVSKKGCECSTSTSMKLFGVTDCNNLKLVAHLNPQFWIGYTHFKGKQIVVTSDCPQDYCSNSRVQLPDNSLHITLDNLVCSNNRNETLCGKCQQGYYVYVNSPTYQCGLCNNTLSKNGFLIIIITKYVPLTLMMCFIMFFDISLVDGPLNSFIIFSQIFGTLPLYDKSGLATERQHISSVLLNIVDFFYNIWDLKFFEYFVKPFCIMKFDSTVPIFVEEYIPAFYLLFLCIMFFNVVPWIYNCCAHSRLQAIQNCVLRMERMCIRFRYHWSVKNSVIHSLTTFLVLSYARITLVTFKILTPSVLYGPGGQDSSYQKTVVWFDGTKSYFGSEHLPYALGAILIFIIFVLIPPLLLLSYPFLPALVTQLGFQDYWIINKLIINPLGKCVPIFDAFQSCYKDEYRFFAGFLFVYRIIASAVFAFTPTTALNLTWLIGFSLTILLLHCICQPYKKRWHNCIEGFIFTVLALMTTISFYRLYQLDATNIPANTSFWIQIAVIYCPLVYFLGYTSFEAFQWLRPRIALIKDILSGNDNNPLDVADLLNSRQFPARIEDGDNYSTASETTSEYSVPDDEQQEHQQQPLEQNENDNFDDVEMIHSVEWNKNAIS